MRFLALLPVLLLACSNDTFVSTDDGGDDAAQVDVVTADAPVPTDAGGGPDACSIGLACAGTEVCVTFDPDEGPFADSSQGGSTGISKDESVTCPSSLESDLPPTGAQPGRAVASAGFTDGTAATTLTVSMDLSVWLPSNPNGTFTAFKWWVENGDAVELKFTGATWELVVEASGQIAPLDQPVTGGWNHMVLAVLFSSDTGTGTAKLQYDGTSGPQTASIKDRTTTENTILSVGADLGLAGTAVTQKMTAYYDNVILMH